MPIFRKLKGSDTWHWCTNCSSWPLENFEEIISSTNFLPGEHCHTCLLLEKENHCYKSERLSFEDIKQKVAKHLKTAIGIEEFLITFAKQENDIWRINVEYKEKIASIDWSQTASLEIDAISGQIKQFKKGFVWNY